VRVALGADGRVFAPACWTVAAGRTVSLERGVPPGVPALDAVLLPALVNAHSHLDLAGAPAIPAAGRFTDWLLAVGGVRGDRRDVEAEAGRQAGELLRRGVTAVGDIDASAGRATAGRRRAGLPGASYLEIVGVRAESARARLAEALALLDRQGGGGVFGLSPHAPYSVHGDVLGEIARAAERRGLRLAMHLAETPEETRYLLSGDGPFEGFLGSIGRGRPFESPPRLRPVAYADRAGLLRAGCVVVHGNDLDDGDVALLAERRASVVYCHGTHRHFDRARHRLVELDAAGVNVALGTDSGLSNAAVDLLAEARRLLRDRADVDPLLLLRCATINGRRALRLDPAPSLFAAGADADALLLADPPADVESAAARDVAAWAFSDAARPVLTLRGGEPVECDAPPPAAIVAFLDTVRGHG
jgi:cytosine/adenosine deaminase-related metal-dependent hydrolase